MAGRRKKIERLERFFDSISPGKKALAKRLIDREAFLLDQLTGLEADIKANGIKETYQNGENQFGYKESTEYKCYVSFQKNYIQIIRQLTDLLPESAAEELDEFEKLVGGLG